MQNLMVKKRPGASLSGLLLLLLALLGAGMVLSACGQNEAAVAAGAVDEAVNPDAPTYKLLSQSDNQRTRPPVTVVATRTAASTTVGAEAAAPLLTAWAVQSVGVSPAFSDARGTTRTVVAAYEIPTQQQGIILANIDASRARYSGQVQGGGYEVLLLGGGSSLSNADISVQINTASLGYLQLPATTYPASASAAQSQLLQAFPALGGYELKPVVQAPGDNRVSYNFYASKKVTRPGIPPTVSPTAVLTGVVKLGNNIWVYAMIGTGTFAPSLPGASL